MAAPGTNIDTIAAISTPPGRGGIGIVRLSGPQAASIAAQLVRLRQPLEHARARLADVLDEGSKEQAAEPERLAGEEHEEHFTAAIAPADGVESPDSPESVCGQEPASAAQAGRSRASAARIDEALVTFFGAPHSYTAEDVVEIAAHGSPLVLEQAEAVRDLIEAQTLTQARQAASQLGGALSRRVRPSKQALVELIAQLEAGIDFAEDDLEVAPPAEIARRIGELRPPLAALEASFARGRIVHDGLTLAIVGRPNAGKSSLFNRLVERDRAIVTATPGTTRDTITERISLDGIPLELVDTAGLRGSLREGLEEAEQLGITRSREAMADAALVVVVLDATEPLNDEERRLLTAVQGRPALVVVNKSDLANEMGESGRLQSDCAGLPVLATSALTGEGIAALRERILALATGGAAAEPGILTNLRHRQAVATALSALDDAAQANASSIPHEMILLDLYRALWALDSLTGQTTPDEILNLIFASFCIGK